MKDSERPDMGSVLINAEECKGCGLCVEACHFGVLHQAEYLNRNGYHPVVYDGHGCTACGLCYYTCPEPGALTVYSAPVRRVVVPQRIAA